MLLIMVVVGARADDSIAAPKPQQPVKESLFDKVYEVIKDFSRVDKHYIEPQHYNYTVMLQNTNTYESYTYWHFSPLISTPVSLSPLATDKTNESPALSSSSSPGIAVA